MNSKPTGFRVLEDRNSRSRSTASRAAKSSRAGRTNAANSVTGKKPRGGTRPRLALGTLDSNSQNSQSSVAGDLAKKSYRLVTESDDSSLNKGIGGVQLDFSKDFRAKSRRRKTGAGTTTSLRRSARFRTQQGQSGSESSLSALPLSVPRNPCASRPRTAKRVKTETASGIPSLAEKISRGDSLDSLELNNSDKKSEAGAEQGTDAQSSASTSSGEPSSSRSVRITRTSKKRARPSASVRVSAGTKTVSTVSARRSASRSRAASRGTDRSQSRARALRSGSAAKKKSAVAKSVAASGNDSDGSESSGGGGFELDAELQAKLYAHNRRVRKSTTFDYVPQQHSRKDYAEVSEHGTAQHRIFMSPFLFALLFREKGWWGLFRENFTRHTAQPEKYQRNEKGGGDG